MTPQERYWNLLVQMKVHGIYLNRYHGETVKIERYLLCFLAICSSSSIGAWAIFKEYAFVWGFIIAVSQVISAIQHHLPYKRRLKALSSWSYDHEKLVIDMEHDWHVVSIGDISDIQIQKKITGFRSQALEREKKHIESDSLPSNERLLTQAESDATKYFMAHYGVPAKET